MKKCGMNPNRAFLLSLIVALCTLTAHAQGFSNPKDISNNTGASFSPQMAVDSSGNINVVWTDMTPGNDDVFFGRSTDGGATFSTPKNLSNNNGNSFSPEVTVDGSGNIDVVWEDATPGNNDIFFSRSTDGGTTFSTPKNISNNSGSSGVPQIAVDASGDINVAWQDDTPANNEIFFSRSTDGGATFSTPQNISDNTGRSQFPQIAVDGSGNINVVWFDDTSLNLDIFFSRSANGGGTFTTPLNVSNNSGASQFPQIAVDSSGNINLVWTDSTTGNSEILFSRSTNGGSTFVTKNVSNNTGGALLSRIAVDSSGNINVVWESNISSNHEILFGRSTDGGTTFSTSQNISNTTGFSTFERIAVDGSGNINVVWSDETPGNGDIFFSRSIDGGTTFSTPQNLSNDSGGSGSPEIAVNASGGIKVVWNDNTPGNIEIFFSRSVTRFSTFSAKLNIFAGPPPSFTLNATFTLDASSNGINPLTEPVALQIGTYNVTIPAGSFALVKQGAKKGSYTFSGVIGGVSLTIQMEPPSVTGDGWSFKATGTPEDLTGLSNPVTVTVTIGDDSGTTAVTARFQ